MLSAATLAGCGGTKHTSALASAHTRSSGHVLAPLRVVASAYPLAQLAQYIGGKAVTVVDLAGAGVQPQGLSLSRRARQEIAGAALVVEVGDGYQPQVEQAAGRRPHLALLPLVSKTSGAYQFWLDPTLMSEAGFAMAKAMTKAGPGHARQFENGARDFQSLASSIGSDYVNSLSTCTRTDFMTTDNAFGRLAARFGLHDMAITSLGTKKAVALVRQHHLPAVFTEVGVGSGLLQLVAGLSGAKVKTLNPLEVAPLSGTPKTNSYFSVMEQNLNALEGPLSCDTSEVFS